MLLTTKVSRDRKSQGRVKEQQMKETYLGTLFSLLNHLFSFEALYHIPRRI